MTKITVETNNGKIVFDSCHELLFNGESATVSFSTEEKSGNTVFVMVVFCKGKSKTYKTSQISCVSSFAKKLNNLKNGILE